MRTRRRWRALVAIAALVAVARCGGGGGDKGALDEPVEDVARLQPGDRPVRFRLDTAVSDDMQRFVVETLGWVHADLGDSGPLTVHVYSDEEHFVTAYTNDFGISAADARRQLAAGETAFASPGGHIWIYLTNFDRGPEINRRMALFHEYAHSVQMWQADIRFQSRVPDERSFVPRWMVEGCAEYLAVKAAGRRQLIDDGRQRAVVVGRAKTSTEPLEAAETGGEASFLGGQSESYTLGWLGCERLALAKGEDAVAHAFWLSFAKRREWQAAFTDAFGLTPAAFYADFATFRTTL
jgi:hypothetical protein